MTVLFMIRDDRQFKALTGVSREQFEKLGKFFAGVYEEMLQKAYEEAVGRGERKRKRGGGRKGRLPTVEEKLFFVLYYLKVYPTFDVFAGVFGMSRSKACENLHKLMPILHETLRRIGVVPERQFVCVGELRKICAGIDDIIIDVVERAHRRPGDAEKQSSMYSGKKKMHTVKNTVTRCSNFFV
ncbi:MAG: transposase family protein [Desulfobacterales bacterium]|nr:transposase family protein [Desulfobacterales bacterium]